MVRVLWYAPLKGVGGSGFSIVSVVVVPYFLIEYSSGFRWLCRFLLLRYQYTFMFNVWLMVFVWIIWVLSDFFCSYFWWCLLYLWNLNLRCGWVFEKIIVCQIISSRRRQYLQIVFFFFFVIRGLLCCKHWHFDEVCNFWEV